MSAVGSVDWTPSLRNERLILCHLESRRSRLMIGRSLDSGTGPRSLDPISDVAVAVSPFRQSQDKHVCASAREAESAVPAVNARTAWLNSCVEGRCQPVRDCCRQHSLYAIPGSERRGGEARMLSRASGLEMSRALQVSPSAFRSFKYADCCRGRRVVNGCIEAVEE